MSFEIQEAEVCCKDRRKYAHMLGNGQSHFYVKKYAKQAAV